MSNKSIEYIAIKSKELLASQIAAYHNLDQKAVVMIVSVFIK